MLSRRERERLVALDRRRAHLEERLETWSRGNPGRTRQELDAVQWAIGVAMAASFRGILGDLTQERPPFHLTQAILYVRDDDGG